MQRIKVNNIYLTSCFSLDFDLELLDYFISYYKSLGIKKENFLLVLNVFKDFNNLKKGLEILEKHDVKPGDIWCQEYESEEKWERVHRLLSKKTNDSHWIVHPDADEFFQFPDSLEVLTNQMNKLGVNAIQGFLIDRVASNGKVTKVNSSSDLSIFDQFPVKANFANLIGLTGVKLMMYKGHMRANNGSGQIHSACHKMVNYIHGGKESLHMTDFAISFLGNWSPGKLIEYNPKKFTKEVYNKIEKEYGFIVHHFKWHGEVLNKLEQRYQTYKILNRPQMIQSKRLLDHYKENKRFVF